MTKLDQSYWTKRYKELNTGWDIGYASTPITSYFDTYSNQNLNILIPGAGNAYEAEYLNQKGFKNVTILDYCNIPLENFQKRNADFDKNNIVCGDFFEHTGSYDLIIEQTFFCALNPSLREKYVQKCYELLKPKGKLIGLLFIFPLTKEGPPFGGSISEYIHLFQQHFKIITLEPCYNSIKPRSQNEVFIIFEKQINS